MLLSVVTPVYNEEENIEYFYTEVLKYTEDLPLELELIFVDDGSRDRTPFILQRLAQTDHRVRAISLARNFGHQIALTCGMDCAHGDAVITMDGDMQHPPVLIPTLVQKWQEGYDVIQTIREATEDAGFLKRLTSKGYYKLINLISQIQVTPGGSDFRLLDRKVVDTFCRFHEHVRFIRGIVGDIGYRQTTIFFTAPKRHAGQSKFSFRKMLHFALDGIMAYSTLPLRLAFYIGLLSGFASLLLTFHVLYCKLTNTAVPGWATTTILLSLVGGVQLISIGIIGEYIGRIFEEVKHRPLYWLCSDSAKPAHQESEKPHN